MRKVCVVEVAYEHLWLSLGYLLQKPARCLGAGNGQAVMQDLISEWHSNLLPARCVSKALDINPSSVRGCREQHCRQPALKGQD